jgi:hypothetical protein
MFKSNDPSNQSALCNELREGILMYATEHMLLPDAACWAKNCLQDEAQECADEPEFVSQFTCMIIRSFMYFIY